MIADVAAYATPIRQILDLLSAEEFVPEPARDVMRPVSEGLAVAQTLGPPLQNLVTASWDSLSGLGAATSVAAIGDSVAVLVDSAADIARITAVAAEIVVRGTAKVTRGEDNFLVSENESTFIPLGTRHRLENPGRVPLEMIEVQSGAYLGEDDIVRFEDVYGR